MICTDIPDISEQHIHVVVFDHLKFSLVFESRLRCYVHALVCQKDILVKYLFIGLIHTVRDQANFSVFKLQVLLV